MMDAKLEPVLRQLDGMQADIAELKAGPRAAVERLDRIEENVVEIREDGEIIREAVNRLLCWAEKVSIDVQIPLLGKRTEDE